MFIKKSSDFDAELVKDYEKKLYARADLDETKLLGDDAVVETTAHEMSEVDKLKKVVALLSEACAMIEDNDKYEEVCAKIMKAIKKLGKITDDEVVELNPSESVEKEVQEQIEEQAAE